MDQKLLKTKSAKEEFFHNFILKIFNNFKFKFQRNGTYVIILYTSQFLQTKLTN